MLNEIEQPGDPTTGTVQLAVSTHEEVAVRRDAATGYVAIIAVHSTRLGPAVGGTRLWAYPSEREAIEDALRLSRGMTYKNAAAGLPLGGGKSVILKPAGGFDREALLLAHGRFVQSFGGRYVAAEDVGTSPADVDVLRRETPFVAGLSARSGDPSPWTARGVLRAIEACARHRWGSADLAGRRFALQGCGNVGYALAMLLAERGAALAACDVDPQRLARVTAETGARPVAPEDIYDVEADVFVPCALGGTVNGETIPRLRAEIVAGAANNQLRDPSDGDALHARGILYAPDYVANAGGVINGCREIVGWSPERSREQVDRIHDRVLEVVAQAAALGISTARAADLYTESRLVAPS